MEKKKRLGHQMHDGALEKSKRWKPETSRRKPGGNTMAAARETVGAVEYELIRTYSCAAKIISSRSS